MDQTSIAYYNGDFMPLSEVRLSPLDRGFLFADGIYELVPAYRGQLFRLEQHLDRLLRGLSVLRLDSGFGRDDWRRLFRQMVEHNGEGNLSVYLQVTRGAAATRDHAFPDEPEPTVFAMTSLLKPIAESILDQGIAVVTVPDQRWQRCDIKSIALLANVLARQDALDRNAADALLVRDGVVTEAAAGNLFIVRDGVLLTPPKDWRILPGITRDFVLELADRAGITRREVDLPLETVQSADEIWITSSTKEILPVTRLDGSPVGNGHPGPVWQRLIELFQKLKFQI